MKLTKIITKTMLFLLCAVMLGTLMLPAASAAAVDMEVYLDFLNTEESSKYLVYNFGMKAAGNSTTMGYKGWLGSVDKVSTSVFKFSAEEGKNFENFFFGFRGYMIGNATLGDKMEFYVSTDGEADFTAITEDKYTADKWTLAATLLNDSILAGTAGYIADPTNRDPEILREIDLTSFAVGNSVVYVRVDFTRSANFDGSIPATYCGAYQAKAKYIGTDNTPVTTAAETTAEPVITTAPEITTAAVQTTAAPIITTVPETTVATAQTTAPVADNTTKAPENEKKGCSNSAVINAFALVLFAICPTALFIAVKKK